MEKVNLGTILDVVKRIKIINQNKNIWLDD